MTVYAFDRTVACQLFVGQFPTANEAEAFAAECNGLQYPCGEIATQRRPLHDIEPRGPRQRTQ